VWGGRVGCWQRWKAEVKVRTRVQRGNADGGGAVYKSVRKRASVRGRARETAQQARCAYQECVSGEREVLQTAKCESEDVIRAETQRQKNQAAGSARGGAARWRKRKPMCGRRAAEEQNETAAPARGPACETR